MDSREIERLQGLVDQARLTVRRWRRGREDIQPSRRDDADSKGNVTRIDEVDFHR
jgi:hypothetical protein